MSRQTKEDRLRPLRGIYDYVFNMPTFVPPAQEFILPTCTQPESQHRAGCQPVHCRSESNASFLVLHHDDDEQVESLEIQDEKETSVRRVAVATIFFASTSSTTTV